MWISFFTCSSRRKDCEHGLGRLVALNLFNVLPAGTLTDVPFDRLEEFLITNPATTAEQQHSSVQAQGLVYEMVYEMVPHLLHLLTSSVSRLLAK
jgi:hypothetical protein